MYWNTIMIYLSPWFSSFQISLKQFSTDSLKYQKIPSLEGINNCLNGTKIFENQLKKRLNNNNLLSLWQMWNMWKHTPRSQGLSSIDLLVSVGFSVVHYTKQSVFWHFPNLDWSFPSPHPNILHVSSEIYFTYSYSDSTGLSPLVFRGSLCQRSAD